MAKKAKKDVRIGEALELIDRLCWGGGNVIVLDGLDEAVVGSADYQGHTRLIYDRQLIIKTIMAKDGMEYEEADAYVCANIDCLHVGHDPIIADLL
jgi:hypothetical protein